MGQERQSGASKVMIQTKNDGCEMSVEGSSALVKLNFVEFQEQMVPVMQLYMNYSQQMKF
jgi:hypothetical protein